MRKNLIIGVSCCAVVAMAAISCTTPRDITYFPDLNTGETIQAGNYLDIKVKPEDKLSIVVSTQDPALSSLFNLVTTQNSISSSSQGGTIGGTSGGGNGQVSFYTVNPGGSIDFPVLGEIHIEGLTRYQIASRIKEELTSRNLVKDPIVTVEYENDLDTLRWPEADPPREAPEGRLL